MAFTYIGSNGAESASTTSRATDTPMGTTTGDITFAFCCIQNGSSFVVNTIPTGYTLIDSYIANNDKYYLAYRISTGLTDPLFPTRTFTGSCKALCWNFTYRGGFDTTNPIQTYSNTAYRTSNTSIIGASITTTTSNCPLLFFGGVFRTSTTSFTKPSVPNTNWVEDYDAGSTVSDFWQTACSMVRSSSGATGDAVGGVSATLTDKHAFLIALNPDVIANTSNMFMMF